jgi:hypothetical protein
MGMDPIAKDETYEVTIVLEGPVNRVDFQKFRDALKAFLDNVTGDGTLAHPGIPNTHQNPPPPKNVLQVREGRAGQRKNAP